MAGATARTVLGNAVPATGVLFPLLARTASPTPSEFGPPQKSVGVMVRLDTTAQGAAPSVVFNIEGYDPAADEWFLLLASAAVTATGTSIVLRVDPRITAGANLVAQSGLVARMRVTPVHGNGDSLTYSVTVFTHG